MDVPLVSSYLSNDTQFLFEPKTQESPISYFQSIALADSATETISNKNPDIELSFLIKK